MRDSRGKTYFAVYIQLRKIGISSRNYTDFSRGFVIAGRFLLSMRRTVRARKPPQPRGPTQAETSRKKTVQGARAHIQHEHIHTCDALALYTGSAPRTPAKNPLNHTLTRPHRVSVHVHPHAPACSLPSLSLSLPPPPPPPVPFPSASARAHRCMRTCMHVREDPEMWIHRDRRDGSRYNPHETPVHSHPRLSLLLLTSSSLSR